MDDKFLTLNHDLRSQSLPPSGEPLPEAASEIDSPNGATDPKMAGALLTIVGCASDIAEQVAALLQGCGYQVQRLTKTENLLEELAALQPSLILLGMGQLPSYDLCCRLKADAATQDIPVVFLCANSDFVSKNKVFEVGAADYLTLPLQPEEAIARVNHQLNLAHQTHRLHQESQQREQALRDRQQAEDRYRSIFENATEGIFQASLEGRFIDVNPALARFYGYDSPEDLISSITNIGQQLYVQPKRRDELLVYLRQFGQISEAESQVYRKDGSKIWIAENIWVVHDEAGRILYLEGTVLDITERHQMEVELRQQRQQAESLLGNILPYQIARRLQMSRRTIADSFEEVTVLFADLVGFTELAMALPPSELVALLNQIFSVFDGLAERASLEKIKTIGDAYMVAAGLPKPRKDHAEAIAHIALDMQAAIQRFRRPNGDPFQLRIGINTGLVVAGVIGVKKLTYDLWGDTVNVASRMESTGEPGRIQVTASTYDRIKTKFLFEERGTVSIKGRGEMTTYWLTGCQEPTPLSGPAK